MDNSNHCGRPSPEVIMTARRHRTTSDYGVPCPGAVPGGGTPAVRRLSVQVTRGGEPAPLAGTPRPPNGDAKVARRAQDEGVSAFEFLCQRHVGPAWDIAFAVTGQRQRYLQAQLRGAVATDCRPVVEHLAAFAANSLPTDELATVDEHVRRCRDCEGRVADLDDLGTMLAPVAVPVPPTLVSMSTSRWKAAANAATVVSRSRLGLLSL